MTVGAQYDHSRGRPVPSSPRGHRLQHLDHRPEQQQQQLIAAEVSDITRSNVLLRGHLSFISVPGHIYLGI